MAKTYYEVTGSYVQKLEVGTDRLLEEQFYNAAGELDRKGDQPALVRYSNRDGKPLIQKWYRDGQLDREHGPAVIHPMPGLNKVLKEWWKGNRLHRWHDKPAKVIEEMTTGRVLSEEFFVVGLRSRAPSQGPAVIEYDRETGEAKLRQFWKSGERVRAPRKSASDRNPSP